MFGHILTFIRFSHTVFALPFAGAAMLIAADGWPGWRLCGLIVLCMVLARTAAMVFNRLADWEIDKRNPRTEGRHKLVPRPVAIALLVGTSIAFMVVSSWINPLCLFLSPVALLIVCFYSLTKRFTSFSHFFLGFALGGSPVAAWLAVRGEFAFEPFILAAAVMAWVAGFDLIYATQDHEFDKSEGLHSMVVKLGIPKALVLAQALHWLMFVFLATFGWITHLKWGFGIALLATAGALVYEHQSAAKGSVQAVNQAFFSSNAFVSIMLLVGVAVDTLS